MGSVIDRLNPMSYSFRARLQPLLIALLPLGASIAAWFPEAIGGWNWIAGVLVTVGIPFLFSERIADLGRDKESGLWESWGGAPTTRFLRHRDEKIDAGSKRRIHTSLAKLCPDNPLPSAETEAQEPSAADAVYATVMHVPRTMARDASAEYPLVLAANIRYGFRRNLWAFRAQGIVLGLIGIVACIAKLSYDAKLGRPVGAIPGGATVVCAITLLVFVLMVTRSWVSAAADVYAMRLLEATDRLAQKIARPS